jgi:hypothetical protein
MPLIYLSDYLQLSLAIFLYVTFIMFVSYMLVRIIVIWHRISNFKKFKTPINYELESHSDVEEERDIS